MSACAGLAISSLLQGTHTLSHCCNWDTRTLALEALTTPTCASAAPLDIRSLKPGSHAEERYGLRAVTLYPLSILAVRTLRQHGMDLLRFASYSNRLAGFRTLSLLGYVFPGGLLLMSGMLPSFPSVHPNHNTLLNKSFGDPKNHIPSAVSIFSPVFSIPRRYGIILLTTLLSFLPG